MDLSNLNGVISQEVVPLELEILGLSEESEHLSIVIKELLLGWDSSSTKLLLKELEELWVLLWWDWLLGDSEVVLWAGLSFRLALAKVLYTSVTKNAVLTLKNSLV